MKKEILTASNFFLTRHKWQRGRSLDSLPCFGNGAAAAGLFRSFLAGVGH